MLLKVPPPLEESSPFAALAIAGSDAGKDAITCMLSHLVDAGMAINDETVRYTIDAGHIDTAHMLREAMLARRRRRASS